ncbi:MAG: hypothetical protein JWM95_4697 [Gemmatimonadetes bacterium]|nr:hypothetical protein [Gemmatimonadota bacterium]
MNTNLWLDEARRIADRLLRDALWSNGSCTWLVNQKSWAAADKGWSLAAAGPTLYQGNAGIALFLGELASLTSEKTYARAAQAALRHAVCEGMRLPDTAYGFHTGRVGIAMVAHRFSVLFKADEWQAHARAVVEPLMGNESADRGLDIIAGAAGAIPSLTRLAESWTDPRILASAQRLGRAILQHARWHAAGCSWRPPGPGAARDLTGYAHGAAGFAHAMLELFVATGDDDFHYAARQAHAYENTWYSEAEANWPDHRHLKLTELLIGADARSQVRDHIAKGELRPYGAHCMMAWCHGAPGIGLERLRAWKLCGHPDDWRDAHRAVIATTASLVNVPQRNYSLCHGAFGNATLLLRANAGVPEWGYLRAHVEGIAEEGIGTARREGKWRHGTGGNEIERSLMLGEAGIGLFLLQLTNGEVETPLLQEGTAATSPSPVVPPLLRNEHIRSVLPQTAALADQGASASWPLFTADSRGGDESPAVTAAVWLQTLEPYLAVVVLEHRQQLEECVVELLCAVAGHRLEDRTLGTLLDVVDAGETPEDIARGEFVASPEVWLLNPIESLGAGPGSSSRSAAVGAPTVWLVRASDGKVQASRVGHLVATLLESITGPTTTDQLADQLDLHDPNERLVLAEQILQLLRARVLIPKGAAQQLGVPMSIRWLEVTSSRMQVVKA